MEVTVQLLIRLILLLKKKLKTLKSAEAEAARAEMYARASRYQIRRGCCCYSRNRKDQITHT